MKIIIEDITKEDIKEIIELVLEHKGLSEKLFPELSKPSPFEPITTVMYGVGNG